jgi:hypothetical protein
MGRPSTRLLIERTEYFSVEHAHCCNVPGYLIIEPVPRTPNLWLLSEQAQQQLGQLQARCARAMQEVVQPLRICWTKRGVTNGIDPTPYRPKIRAHLRRPHPIYRLIRVSRIARRLYNSSYTLCAVSETRREKRKSEKLLVLLSRVKEPWLTEAASTENVSSHGMRLLTDRFWKRDTNVIVQSSEYELWARAKVVYCQPFSDRTFAIGLELKTRTGGWIIRSSTL